MSYIPEKYRTSATAWRETLADVQIIFEINTFANEIIDAVDEDNREKFELSLKKLGPIIQHIDKSNGFISG